MIFFIFDRQKKRCLLFWFSNSHCTIGVLRCCKVLGVVRDILRNPAPAWTKSKPASDAVKEPSKLGSNAGATKPEDWSSDNAGKPKEGFTKSDTNGESEGQG